MLRFLTAGESHGPLLSAILDGMPAALPLDAESINRELARRQQGYGRGGRMSIEHDQVHLAGGVVAGKTTGAPIALLVENRDYRNWANKTIPPMTVPRPGHADLTAAVKYGYRELRLSLERASARETTMRVAVGAICKRLLAEFGIHVQGYVVSVGDVEADLPDLPDAVGYQARFAAAEASDVRCPRSASGGAHPHRHPRRYSSQRYARRRDRSGRLGLAARSWLACAMGSQAGRAALGGGRQRAFGQGR